MTTFAEETAECPEAPRKEARRLLAARYHAKNRGAILARKAAWRLANSAAITAYQRAYYEKNCAKKAAEYAAKREEKKAAAAAWRGANRERARQVGRVWAANNPEKVRAKWQKRRAAQKGAEGRYSGVDLIAIMTKQKARCAYCRTSIKAAYHADHIMPLSKGGSNWPKNIQLLCQPCNQRKHAKDPIRFAQERGMLL